MTFGDTIEGILDDQDRAVPKWAGLLSEIMEELARLECGLADMKLECLRLEEAGMWPAVPTESWEGRNGGDKVYLRLVFPRRTSPSGQRKVYIGRDPARIAHAHRKSANRQRWEKLEGGISRLERHLSVAKSTLGRVAEQLARYQLPDLGTPAAPARPAPVPKVEAEHG